MNALVFLVKMTLEEYFNLRDAIDKERERNKSYYLSERTGRGYLFFPKTLPAVFMIPGTVPAVSWKSNWKKMSAYRSAVSLRQTMMAVMAAVSGKFTAAVLICGVIMPSN